MPRIGDYLANIRLPLCVQRCLTSEMLNTLTRPMSDDSIMYQGRGIMGPFRMCYKCYMVHALYMPHYNTPLRTSI